MLNISILPLLFRSIRPSNTTHPFLSTACGAIFADLCSLCSLHVVSVHHELCWGRFSRVCPLLELTGKLRAVEVRSWGQARSITVLYWENCPPRKTERSRIKACLNFSSRLRFVNFWSVLLMKSVPQPGGVQPGNYPPGILKIMFSCLQQVTVIVPPPVNGAIKI